MFQLDELTIKVLICVVAAVVAFVLDRILSRVTRRALEHTGAPNVSLFVNVARGLLWICAVLLVLKPVFGVDPMALVTTLGVISIVVSLGMQDTLSNLIAGFGLMAARVLTPGDVIEVSGVTGEVVDVSWRSTTLMLSDGTTQVIPNSVLNKTPLRKCTPKAGHQVNLPLVVRASADLNLVSADIMDAAHAALSDRIHPDWEPEVRYLGSDSYGVNVVVRLFLLDRRMDLEAKDDLMRELSGKDWLVLT